MSTPAAQIHALGESRATEKDEIRSRLSKHYAKRAFDLLNLLEPDEAILKYHLLQGLFDQCINDGFQDAC